MSGQSIILFFMIFSMGITIFLYVWKAKKQIDYKGDERWLLIQNKANNTANYLNYAIILFLAIGQVMLIFYDINITLTLNRVISYGICFIGLRNTIELFSLIYFDKQL